MEYSTLVLTYQPKSTYRKKTFKNLNPESVCQLAAAIRTHFCLAHLSNIHILSMYIFKDL